MSADDEAKGGLGPRPMMVGDSMADMDPSTQLWNRGYVEGVSLAGLVYPASFAHPLVVKQPAVAGHLLRSAPLDVAVRVSSLLG
jgi:hypothetical protein